MTSCLLLRWRLLPLHAAANDGSVIDPRDPTCRFILCHCLEDIDGTESAVALGPIQISRKKLGAVLSRFQ